MKRHDAVECTCIEHRGYRPGYVRFVRAHQEAFEAAYLDGNGQAARNELERLRREFETLPPLHDCTCWCPNERRGWPACVECRRIRDRVQYRDIAVEIGRTSPVEAPMPMVTMLDVEGGYAA